MAEPRITKRKYQRRPPILNNRDAEKAKSEEKPYQRKVPAAPGTVLRVQPNGTKVWKLIQNNIPRTLGSMPVMTYGMAVEKALAILTGEDPDVVEVTEPTPEPEAFTFGQYIEEHYKPYVKQHHSDPKGTLGYLRRFGMDDKPLDDNWLADIEAWRLTRLEAGRKPRSINRQTTCLKAALQRAVDWDLLPDNPLRKLKLLKVDKRPVVRYLDDDEYQRLQDALKARDDELRAKRESGNRWRSERGYKLLPALGEYADNLTPLVMLALCTGLRRGELWQLRWGDIDLKKNMLTVHGHGAKSKQTRVIPLNATAQHVLKTHKGAASPLPRVYVFGRHEFKKAFAAVLKSAQIDSFTFHCCRHTFASRLVMAGIPLIVVKELLGHASIDMTLIYSHLSSDSLRNAVEVLS